MVADPPPRDPSFPGGRTLASPPFGSVQEQEEILRIRSRDSIETSARATGTSERAGNVLRKATGVKGKVQTSGVGLALWVLRRRRPDEWLVAF